jgi:hypothetical protein
MLIKTSIAVLALVTLLPTVAPAATVFMGAYPDAVIVFDEAKGQIVQRIPLSTDLSTSMRLSQDCKTIYVTTNDRSGIEVIDIATRKVTNKFFLNTPTKRYRFNGGVPDPTGKLFYTVSTEMSKLADRYDVGKPKYTVIDLREQKIVKTRASRGSLARNTIVNILKRHGIEPAPERARARFVKIVSGFDWKPTDPISGFLNDDNGTVVKIGFALGQNLQQPWPDCQRCLVTQSKNNHTRKHIARRREQIAKIQIESEYDSAF